VPTALQGGAFGVSSIADLSCITQPLRAGCQPIWIHDRTVFRNLSEMAVYYTLYCSVVHSGTTKPSTLHATPTAKNAIALPVAPEAGKGSLILLYSLLNL
jgi:hypothetical protein